MSPSPLGFTYNGTPYFYLLSLQGDVIAVYDSTGEIVIEYTYDSWGKLISSDGPLAGTIGIKNPIRYRGYYYDVETGLYYLQSRYYDPETGRFINPDAYLIAGDDVLQGTNMYAYCYNNPVMYVDPSGCECSGVFDSSDELAVNVFMGITGAWILSSLAEYLGRSSYLYITLYKYGVPKVVDFDYDIYTLKIKKNWAGIIEDLGGFVIEFATAGAISVLGYLAGGTPAGLAAGISSYAGEKVFESLSNDIFKLVSPGEYAFFDFYITLDKGNYEYELIEFSVLKYIGNENKGFSTFEWFI